MQSDVGPVALSMNSLGLVMYQKERSIKGAPVERCRLWNDLIVHRTVEELFAQAVEQSGRALLVHVLHLSSYISKEDKRW